MVRLSIIIPVLGKSDALDDTLVSVLENQPANCEVVVVHTEPYDDPYGLAGEVRFVKASAKANRVECLNLGIAASHGAVVHSLACGVEVCQGWADAAMARFRDPCVAAVAAVVRRADRPGRIVSAGLHYGVEGVIEPFNHESDMPCSPDPSAAFYRKAIIDALGGFRRWSSASIAAVDLAMAMQESGHCCVLEPASQAKADVAILCDKPGFRYGRDAEWLFRRWAKQHGAIRSAIGHAALIAGECTVALWRPSLVLRLLGRLWAMVRSLPIEYRARPHLSTEAVSPSVLSSPCFATDEDAATARAA